MEKKVIKARKVEEGVINRSTVGGKKQENEDGWE
jgi:hypothetical protein